MPLTDFGTCTLGGCTKPATAEDGRCDGHATFARRLERARTRRAGAFHGGVVDSDELDPAHAVRRP